MAVAVQTSLEEYLANTYDPDCDYVDGEVRERNMADWNHATCQTMLVVRLAALQATLGFFVRTELRVQVKPDRFRVPDVTVTLARPQKRWVTPPPHLAIEVLSDGQSLADIQDRIDDYFTMGVPHIWIVDPVTRRGWDASSGMPREAQDAVLRTEAPEIVVPLRELSD